MKFTLIFLARDRTTAWEHARAGLFGVDGILPITSYDAVAMIPMHGVATIPVDNVREYNILLAAIEATFMCAKAKGLSRHMVPGDLVVFENGNVFLADVPAKWTLLDPERAAPFKLLAEQTEPVVHVRAED